MGSDANHRAGSFRARITAWNVLISGVVLAVVLVAFLVITWRIGLDRIDREVLAIGHHALRSSHPASYWGQFANSLQTVMGEERAHPWFITVRQKSGAVISETPDSPEPFLAAARAWSEKHDRPNPPARLESVEARAQNHFQAIENMGRGLGPERIDAIKNDVLLMLERGRSGPEVEIFVNRALRDAGANPLRRGPGRGPGRDGTRRPGRRLHPEPVEFSVNTIGGETYRLGFMGNEEVNMVLAAPLVSLEAENRRLRMASSLGFLGALGLLAFGGRILAQRALSPVEQMAETVNRVSTRDLGQRIAHIQADREFHRLIDGINDMLERLERGFLQASRFSADAAHELNTPLAVLQGEIESMLHQEPEGSPEQLAFSALLEEVQRLKAVTHTLLLLAKADAGTLPVDQQEVWLSDIVAAALEDAEVMAGDLLLESEIESGILVRGDGAMLRQVVSNLMTNAIKYNREGGYIRTRLEFAGDEVFLHVKNPGTQLDQLDTERIFDRFYRADESRKRQGFGVGLGLSLSREIVLAHAGSLDVSSVDADEITFTLRLPAEQRVEPDPSE